MFSTESVLALNTTLLDTLHVLTSLSIQGFLPYSLDTQHLQIIDVLMLNPSILLT